MKVKQTLAAIIVLSAAATQTERTAGCLIRSHGNWYLPYLAGILDSGVRLGPHAA